MTDSSRPRWPVLRTYPADRLRRIALPLGGIGTGTVSLGGRGDLRDWEVMNRPAKGYTPDRGFFALRVEAPGQPPIGRALEGRIDPADYEGAHGSTVPGHGLPRFREVRFEAAYPLGQVVLHDPDVPADVRLQAHNPFVPTDADASGFPAAVLRYLVTNPTRTALRVTVCGNLPNIVGYDGSAGAHVDNRNVVRRDGDLLGVLATSDGVPRDAEQSGTLALVTRSSDTDEVTTRTSWAERSWGGGLLDFWDDLITDGRLDDRDGPEYGDRTDPTASLAVTRTVPPGATTAFTFYLTWCFPNRLAWDVNDEVGPQPWTHTDDIVGNHYATRWSDAWAVACDLAGQADELEAATVDFVDTFCRADLPEPVKEAALFNLSTLRTQTCLRTADGHFYGWEGCGDRVGSCLGSCTHVWNYEPATAHLFGTLARSMREIEFGYATDERGLMSFRVLQPLETRAQEWGVAAADGQLGALLKLYREWRMSGDEALLDRLWPAAKRALEFCWIPGGWDADADGVMEGCQHNTMDVEYYGPNPQMGAWYLAALRAMEELARHRGEAEFAERCRTLFENGSRWLDEHLFTGSYYRHEIRPAYAAEAIASGLRHPTMGARDLAHPELQLGDGCLIDQLVGQVLAHQSGLGHLLVPDHVGRTLESVVRLNRRAGFDGHFNPMRSYVLGDETALLMCSYDEGKRPDRPFPYAAEVMTGFEYTAAVGLAYEGKVEEAVRVVADIRDRYDGWKRNPFDEAECGHHYARAMASWGMVLALSGFDYQAGDGGILRLRGRDGGFDLWSTGDAWGWASQRHDSSSGEVAVELACRRGRISVSRIVLTGLGACPAAESVLVPAGKSVTLTGRTD